MHDSLSRILKLLTDSHNHVRVTLELNPTDQPTSPPRSDTHAIDTPFGPVHTKTPVRPAGPTDPSERNKTESILVKAGVSAKQATLLAHARPFDYCDQVVAWVATHRPNVKNPGGYIRTIIANGSAPWATTEKPKGPNP